MTLPSDRFEYLFDEATRLLPKSLKALFAEHAAKGRLKAGVTVIRSARIAGDLSKEAVAAALEAVSLATATPGRKRTSLLDDLQIGVESWIAATTDQIATRIAKFGLSRNLLEPLMANVRRERLDDIEQYRGGWTAPPPKPWKDRRPTLHAITLLVVGGLLGLALGSVVLPKINVASALGFTANVEAPASPSK